LFSITWRRSDSNRRPPACKAGALPTELRPQRNPLDPPAHPATPNRAARMGQGGLEPPTPRLSSVCSNQLSYWPKNQLPLKPRPPAHHASAKPRTHQARAGKDARPAPVPAKTRIKPAARPTNHCRSVTSEPARSSRGIHRETQFKANQCVSERHSRRGKPLAPRDASLKGGDPAAGSPTATLLRLHPSH
jgi:hypothetical protein